MTQREQPLLMLIDNEPLQIRLISTLAARKGWHTMITPDGKSAVAALDTPQGARVAAIIVDQLAPDTQTSALTMLRKRRPTLPILALVPRASPLLTVKAMQAGATDYLLKPVDTGKLIRALDNMTGKNARPHELAPLAEKMPIMLKFDAMVGTAPPFRDALAKAAKAARGYATALIEGESGTGKELLVHAMHAASPRSKATLRTINIPELSDSALKSALFGHEKDAFPGAFEQKFGAFQLCDGGTLVLNEVGNLPLDLQKQLAQTLRSACVRPVGAAHGFSVDVRIIATSSTSLANLVATGQFRAELCEILSGTKIVLPPLRKRAADIPPLAHYFLAYIGRQPGLRPLSITDNALQLLAAYSWPGNISQLQAVLFRAAISCKSNTLTCNDFSQLSGLIDKQRKITPAHSKGGGVQLHFDDGHLRTLAEIEADIIRLAIGHYGGRMTEVARRLGIGRSTLYRKLRELGINNAA